jgi:hypothetical protein
MNHVYSLDTIDEMSMEWLIKDYFDKVLTFNAKNTLFTLLYNLNKPVLLKYIHKKWVELEPEDKNDLRKLPETSIFLEFDKNNYNPIIGFVGYEKHNKYLVFKTKNLNAKNNTGARCDDAGKVNTIKNINLIVGDELFTNENTKMHLENGVVTQEATTQTELCIIQEFILRYYNQTTHNNKKWFLTPEFALYNKLYTIITV